MENISKKEWLAIVGYTLGAFAIRFFFLRYEYMITPDGVYYVTLGKNFISGNMQDGLSTYWTPLYPFLVGLTSLFFQNLELSGRVVSVLAGSLLVVPEYVLIRNFYGKNTASLGIFLIILFPLLLHYSTMVLTESVYLFLFVTAIFVGWKAVSEKKRTAFFFTGILFGACYLTRPEAVGFIGLLVGIEVCSKIFYRDCTYRKIFCNSLLLLLGFLMLSLPYMLYLHQETGKWTISEKIGPNYPDYNGEKNRWYSLSEDGETTLADRMYGGVRTSKQSPSPQIDQKEKKKKGNINLSLSKIILQSTRGVKNIYTNLIPQIFPPLILFFVGVGLFRSPWPKERIEKEIYLSLFLFSTVIGYSVMFVYKRQLTPLVPILICWAAKGIDEVITWLAETLRNNNKNSFLVKKRSFLTGIVLGIVFLSLFPSITTAIRRTKWEQMYEYKEASIWIKERSHDNPLIMARVPQTAFYAEGRHLYLPDEKYSTIMEYARRKKVDYILVDQSANWATPNITILLNEKNDHPGLTLVYTHNENPRNKLLLYTVNK